MEDLYARYDNSPRRPRSALTLGTGFNRPPSEVGGLPWNKCREYLTKKPERALLRSRTQRTQMPDAPQTYRLAITGVSV
jgi:hypothetical protein